MTGWLLLRLSVAPASACAIADVQPWRGCDRRNLGAPPRKRGSAPPEAADLHMTMRKQQRSWTQPGAAHLAGSGLPAVGREGSQGPHQIQMDRLGPRARTAWGLVPGRAVVFHGGQPNGAAEPRCK